MDSRAGFPLPHFLDMPLRDVARGLAGFAHFTEETFAPVHASLPKPVQAALTDAASLIKSRGASLVARSPELSEIDRAAQYLTGQASGPGDAAACAKVIAFAWDHLEVGDLVSETLLASYLANRAAAGADPYAHAAALILDMPESNAFGAIPGLPALEGGDPHAATRQKLIIPAIWLIADREGSIAAELHLLELAIALSGAFAEDLRAALADRDKLATVIRNLADHL